MPPGLRRSNREQLVPTSIAIVRVRVVQAPVTSSNHPPGAHHVISSVGRAATAEVSDVSVVKDPGVEQRVVLDPHRVVFRSPL